MDTESVGILEQITPWLIEKGIVISVLSLFFGYIVALVLGQTFVATRNAAKKKWRVERIAYISWWVGFVMPLAASGFILTVQYNQSKLDLMHAAVYGFVCIVSLVAIMVLSVRLFYFNAK